MSLYGNTFTLVDPNDHDVGSPANGTGLPGAYTREAGKISYYEVYGIQRISELMYMSLTTLSYGLSSVIMVDSSDS